MGKKWQTILRTGKGAYAEGAYAFLLCAELCTKCFGVKGITGMAHGPYGKIFGKVYLRDFQKELLFSPQSFILVKAKKRQCCQSLYSIERECGTWSENNPVETVEHQKGGCALRHGVLSG